MLGYVPRTDAGRLRREIGSQLQESALPDRIKVWEALDLFSSLVPSGQPWETVMEQWGLSPKRDAKFGNLSGGQQQRLLVALAVVNAPRLVFFDEMTTGLDPMSRRATWDLVGQVRDQGATVVLVTHFMDEAEALCDRIAVMYLGKVVELAPTPRLFDHPAHPYTHALLSGIPVPAVKFSRGRIVLSGDVPSPADPPAACRFHTRCPFVLPICREVMPPMAEISSGHWVACHRRDEVPRLVKTKFGKWRTG